MIAGAFVPYVAGHRAHTLDGDVSEDDVLSLLQSFKDRKLIRVQGSTVWVPASVPAGARANEWRRR